MKHNQSWGRGGMDALTFLCAQCDNQQRLTALYWID